MGWAARAGCEGHGVQAAKHRKGRTEDSGHQLVSGVRMEGSAAGVTLVFSPDVLCVRDETERV